MSNTILFFKELAKIPRESGNEKAVADYLVKFAKSRNLPYYQDAFNNVLIKKENKDLPCLILQAHTDMVCVSDNENFDFAHHPIEVLEKDGYLYANHTTLGADNGIGVAQILNLLDSDIPCNIEAVFTTSEETTMVGAMNFDTSLLKGKYLLNLDGFDENTILTESAAYYDLVMKLQNSDKFHSTKKYTYSISLSGLLGGHSGYDIDKGRGNAIILMAEFLKLLHGDLISITGGTKNNVFPSSCEAVICTDLENIEDCIRSFIKQYHDIYPTLSIKYENKEQDKECFAHSAELLDFLLHFPSKAIYYNENHLPTTSVNLGVIKDGYLEIGLRSSRKEEASDVLEDLHSYARKHSFVLIEEGYQPGFYSDVNSEMIKILKKTCSYSTLPLITLKHIAVEVGFFQEKISNLQVAIISPKILDAHSIKERVELRSVDLVDQWLIQFIKEFNQTIEKY